jgi:hypothetical protein
MEWGAEGGDRNIIEEGGAIRLKLAHGDKIRA